MRNRNYIKSIKQFKSAFAFGGTEIISKGINWFIPFLLFFISAENKSAYGILAILIAFEHIARTILDMGQRRIIFRFFKSDDDNSEFLSTTFSIWIIATTIILFLFSMILVVFDFNTFFEIPINAYFYTFIASFIAINTITFVSCYFRISKQIIRYSKMHLTINIMRLSTIIILSIITNNVLNGYILGTAISYIAGVIITLNVFKEIKYRFKVKKDIFINNIKYGYPLVLQQLISNLGPNIDKFILASFVTLESIATYNFIVTLTSAFVFITGIMTTYFEPIIFRCRDNHKKLLSANNTFLYSSQLLESTIIIITYIFMHILGYNEFSCIYMLVAISYLLHPLYYYNMYVYMTHDKNLYIVKFTLFAVISVVVADLILINLFGILGAAYAQLVYAIVISWLSYFYMTKKFPMLRSDMNKKIGIVTLISLSICSIANISILYCFLCIYILTTSLVYIFKNKRDVFEAIKGDL